MLGKRRKVIIGNFFRKDKEKKVKFDKISWKKLNRRLEENAKKEKNSEKKNLNFGKKSKSVQMLKKRKNLIEKIYKPKKVKDKRKKKFDMMEFDPIRFSTERVCARENSLKRKPLKVKKFCLERIEASNPICSQKMLKGFKYWKVPLEPEVNRNQVRRFNLESFYSHGRFVKR